MSDDGSDGGLHIDAGWKEEAAREKERLAKEAQAGASKETDSGATFLELVNMLAMQAAISLNGYQGPGGERLPPNPAAARHQIDLLDILEKKTKSNLTEDETRMLDGVLHELRLGYVQAIGGQAPPPPGIA